MNYLKTLILAGISAILLFIFLKLEPYQQWWDSRITPVAEQKSEVGDITSDSLRMEMRFPEMGFYRNVLNFISDQGDSKPILLLPPKGLVAKNNLQFPVPEPVVYYYFTGLSGYWANMPGAKNTTWALTVDNGQPNVIALKDPRVRDSIIAEFNKYEIGL